MYYGVYFYYSNAFMKLTLGRTPLMGNKRSFSKIRLISFPTVAFGQGHNGQSAEMTLNEASLILFVRSTRLWLCKITFDIGFDFATQLYYALFLKMSFRKERAVCVAQASWVRAANSASETTAEGGSGGV